MRKFVRTRGQPRLAPSDPVEPADANKTNGHANGACARQNDQRSTISRYWSESARSGGNASAVAGRVLFEDEEFPAAWRSLGDKKMAQGVVWVRPHELCSRPRFLGDEVVEGTASLDDDEPLETFNKRWQVHVGVCGISPLCAGAAALASTPRLFARACPPHSFTHAHYTGLFRFNFWVFGSWQEVVIDDRLPARASSLTSSLPGTSSLLSSTGGLPDDFTLPLLEKAYAKLHGSYVLARSPPGRASPPGAPLASAAQTLSGAATQLWAARAQLTAELLRATMARATLLFVQAMPEEPYDRGWSPLAGGVLSLQPYALTGLARVRSANGQSVLLVRVRAPSGRLSGADGTLSVPDGSWTRGGAAWSALPPHDQDLLHTDTDVWMSLSSLCRVFACVVALHVCGDDWACERVVRQRAPWRAVLARRRWAPGSSAGGPPNAETTSINPQFHITVGREGACNDDSCHVVVSLMPHYTLGGQAGGKGAREVGFALYELPRGAPMRPAPLHTLRLVHHASTAPASREVSALYRLPAGRYVVAPHQARAGLPGAFLLRFYTDERAHVWEANDDNMLLRDISAEFLDAAQVVPPELRASISKLLGKNHGDEVSMSTLRRLVRGVLPCSQRASRRELCGALLALRDVTRCGSVPPTELPPLLALLHFWKHLYNKWAVWCGGRGALPAARLRGALGACGVRVSNKVLALAVIRHSSAPRGPSAPPRVPLAAFLLLLARIHLAHERYRSLDMKTKSNPLSLEEMILMTIYT